MEERKKYLIGLNLIGKIGLVRQRALLEKFPNPEDVFRASLKELQNIHLIGRELAKRIKDFLIETLERELRLIKEMGVSVLLWEEKEYPENLRNISNPPSLLYTKGKIIEEDKNSLAIVGTRYCSSYGRMMAEKFGFELASAGFTIISGLAKGVDTAAHRGALLSKKRTIAVLGSGLARIYPEENIGLAEKIAKNGAVVSEFPLLTEPEGRNFPRRNRIISGLSNGVVVVEAGIRSGAIITADLALEQGREVFAVPGNVGERNKGVHRLIKEGAKLVETVEDILEEIKSLPQPQPIPSPVNSLVDSNKADVVAVPAQAGIALQEKEKNLSEEEKNLYQLLCDKPLQIEELIKKSSLTISKISQLFVNLEIKGLIRSLPGKFYQRKTTEIRR